MRQTNILLVDGDEMVRQALGQALACENYRVVPAANQQEALDEFGKEQIHIVLLDLNPGNENAWETVIRLIALRPNLPVIAMTTRLDQHSPTTISHTFHRLMAKPLDLNSLIETLHELTPETTEALAPSVAPRLSQF